MKKKEKIRFLDKATLREAWGNIFYVFFRDLKRIVTNPIATGVIVFVLFFPCLYSWVGIHANWDPYANLENLNIAIVNEDKPADTGIAGEINLGEILVNTLKDMPLLGWDFTDRQDAMSKLDAGNVYACIVIPENFSANFAKLFTDSAHRDYIHFDYYINERENGAAVKIFDIGAATIEDKINQKFIETVSNVLVDKVHGISGEFADSASASASSISGKLENVANEINKLNGLVDSGNATIDQLSITMASSKQLISSIKGETSAVLATIDSIRTTNDNIRTRVHEVIDELEAKGIPVKIIKEILQNLESSIDENLKALDKISEIMYKIDNICDQVGSLIRETESITNQSQVLGAGVKDKVTDVYNKLHSLSGSIDGSLSNLPFFVKNVLNSDTQGLGRFLSSPVNMDKHVVSEVKYYGMGAAPFFTNLALWIAGLVLIALLRTEVEPPKRKRWNTNQAYISRGLLFVMIAMLQGIVCSIGCFVIGVECDNPGLFVLTCIIISFTFTSIIYMLSACFKHVGKALAVVLIIMQIPGSSGMFPVAMMPKTFQVMSPFLPFTYGIAALREAIVSPDYLAWSKDILILLTFILVAFIIGIYARKHLTSLNRLFDKKLAKTGLMICDANDHLGATKNSMDELIEILSDSDYDQSIKYNLEGMKYKYSQKRRVALWLMWLLPLSFLAIMSIIWSFVSVEINTKLIFLVIWVFIIIACCSYVIVLEFKVSRIKKYEKNAVIKEAEHEQIKQLKESIKSKASTLKKERY